MKLLRLLLPVIALSLFITLTSRLAADDVSIAAAADLTRCLEELNAAFSKDHPDAVLKVSTGSSGNFFAQIKNGAPFDVFLSADMSYPRQLAEAGLADKQSITLYATGRIVLWSTGRDVDVNRGLDLLKDVKLIKKIAIANPDHAPYGKAAKAALEHYGLWEGVQARLVFGENISQAAQFVQTGNADVGIVALSLVIDPKQEKQTPYFLVPQESYPPLEQGAVLTTRGAAKPLSRAYLEFLHGSVARGIFDRYGFRISHSEK